MGGEGDDRGWDGWMASLTQWTWVWASSGSWWWTEKPSTLQSMGSQRVRHDWPMELNWIETNTILYQFKKQANNQNLKKLYNVSFKYYIVHFSSVTQLCPTLCNPMDCSTPGLPVHHQLPELAQTHVYQVGDDPAISSSVVPFSFCLQSFPALGSFPMSCLFKSGGQSIGASLP